MSKVGVLVWRKIFESGDARRLAKQKQDLSDLSTTRDIPYIDDGDRVTSWTSIDCRIRRLTHPS